MSNIIKLSLIILLPTIICFSSSYGLAWEYQIPNSEELKEIEDCPPELWATSKLKPGLSIYKQSLPLTKEYKNVPEAEKELKQIHKQLEEARKKGSSKYWTTKENLLPLIELIKKYPNSRQAVTAKLLLTKVLNYPFISDTRDSQYWAVDLWRELYLDFPDTWQGKFALFSLYQYMFWPGFKGEMPWCYKYLDDFEAINWEIEEVFAHPEKYPDFESSDSILIDYTHWRYVAEAYCMLSHHVWIIENGMRDEVLKKSQKIYLHKWDLCKQGRKDCSLRKNIAEDLLEAKRSGETSIGPCIPDEFK